MAELILNVDDFEPQRYTRSAVLREAGFEVVEAATGREALALAARHHPDLVLLDVHMPDIDGLEVCRRVKADPATSKILVLHLSATFVESTARVTALENGADGYLAEPVDARELVAQVRSLLRLARAERAAREAEAALAETLAEVQRREAEIASIYDSAPIGLCIFDADGRYLRVNRRLAEINGPSPEEHVGRRFGEILPDVADQAERLLRHVLDTGTPALGVEIRGEAPSRPGVLRTWIENWYPVRDEEGNVVGVNVAVEEITRLKEIEEELRQANRVKDEFLATLSHELRTPLNAILGWSQLLQRGGLPEATTHQALDAIARNAEAQRQLIADVLDVSRMISGKLRLQLSDVDLTEIVGLAVESMRPAAEAREVRLEVSAPTAPAMLTADPDRLQQVVWNLLSNAVKFTPAGGRVCVTVRDGDGSLGLEVADDGAGIRPDFLPHVFDRFAQADASTTRRHSGLGLGLSIVRQLVELHGGTVSAASAGEGKGATFTVTLPAMCDLPDRLPEGPMVALSSAPAGQDRLEGLHVLVVDDLGDARTLARTVVERESGRVTVAASGEEALAAVAADQFDVVLADVAMPEMDGYQLLRRLRRLPAWARRPIPIVAVTAYGSEEDRAKALEAGFAEHLPKPLRPDDLVAVIAAVTRRAPR